MEPQGEIFLLDEQVVFRGKPMQVTGRSQFEGANGQLTFRYLLSDAAGAPVTIEEGEGRFALLRALPAVSRLQNASNTIIVGTAKYTLVGVRKLKVLDLGGKVPGVEPGVPMILSGIFEGPMGTLMRELVPGMTAQRHYLVKPLTAGEVVSAVRHAAEKDAAARAAGNKALDGD